MIVSTNFAYGNNAKTMIVTFKEQYLEDLYKLGVAKDKKHRYQPNVIRGYQKGIKFLINAKRPENLKTINSLNFESLKGDKKGIFSIRANGQYRIEFTINENMDESILTICNVVDLSNHYK